jgi:hypothetical protein
VYISELVVRECGDGDKQAAEARLSAIADFPLLDLTEDCHDLAAFLVAQKAVPAEYPEDALHIAVGAVHGIDYLLTWNFKHINNAVRRTAIEKAVEMYGYACPVICTPEELTGE